jgi:hypothetical protein
VAYTRRNKLTLAHRAEMVRLFRDGMPLRMVGKNAGGFSAAIVWSVLESEGINPTDDPPHLRWRPREARAVRREARERNRHAKEYFGCTHAEAVAVNGDPSLSSEGETLAARYLTQRNSAGQRGIQWAITFPEWVGVWERSGKLAERGRGSYVMARNGDVGPYAVWNVRIITHSENSKESRANVYARGVLCADGYWRYPENIKPEHEHA